MAGKTVHSVVRTDLMQGTDVRNGLVSVRYMGSGEDPTEIDNARVVKLDGFMEGERELRKGVTPTGNEALDDVVLIATPEVPYDERLENLEDFVNEAGANIRGYHFYDTDIFSATVDSFDLSGVEAPAVGNTVELKAGIKMQLAASPTGPSNTVIGKVIAVETAGRHEYVVVEVKHTPAK